MIFISQELKRTRGYKGPVDTRDQWLPGTNGLQGPGTTKDQGAAHMDKALKRTSSYQGPRGLWILLWINLINTVRLLKLISIPLF